VPEATPEPDGSGRIARSADTPAQHSAKARLAGRLIAWLLRLLTLTWRIETEGVEILDGALARGEKLIVIFWHGKYIPLFSLLIGRSACVLSSVSFRGDVIAEIGRHFGYDAVQIPDHGGEHSYGLMREALSEHASAAIAVDGPLGPLHDVHRGTIRLASDLRRTLIPISVAAAPKRVLEERWDKLEIPLPMSRIVATIGRPIGIPGHMTEESLSEWKLRISAALTELDRASESKLV
jgi:lysophospholipid acyltransferase (LPLAT)-like uncharacterized protein